MIADGVTRAFHVLPVLVSALFLTMLLGTGAARVAEGQPSLKLIPTPQHVQLSEGTFRMTEKVSVVLGNADDPDDHFAAQQLVAEVQAHLGRELRMGKADDGAAILIGRMERDKAVDAAVAKLGLSLPGEAAQEGYILSVKPEGVVVAARTASGIFYGVQTVKQLIRANLTADTIPCCTILDWPALRYRGWQDDISRGPIPTLDYLKREVRTLSEYKLNAFTLYTEHVFKLKKHPTIAPEDGISAEEIKELIDYATRYHVEVIGNFQSFGHFANILKVPGYEHLGEAGWVISPAKEESYQFLADVFSEIAPAYQSPLFNINCDETWGLGEGDSKAMVERMGMGGVYAYHINRVAVLLKPYGKTPMMWGDIALQHPDIVPELPKDLVVLTWGYHPGEEFRGMIKPFTEMGLRFMVCPGVSCWGQVFPDLDAAAINISNFIRDGALDGAMGALNTTWDDTGENLFGFNWYPLLWGAECSWNPATPAGQEDLHELREARRTAFDQAFASVFYGMPGAEVTGAILRLSRLRSNPASAGMRDGAFWCDMKTVASQGGTAADALKLVREAEAIIDALRKAKLSARDNADSIDYAVFATERVRFMGQRVLAAQSLSAARADEVARHKAAAAIAALVGEVSAIKEEYARLWRLENREWWLDRNLEKYDRLIDELKSAVESQGHA